MPVRFNGIELGRPIDLLLDREGRRVVGIEVACGDEADRFLPLAAATIGDNEISTGSAFTVIDDADFYRQRGRTLAQVRGRTVEREGVALGALDDVVVAAHGAVVELVLAGGQRIPFDEALTITATPGRTAA